MKTKIEKTREEITEEVGEFTLRVNAMSKSEILKVIDDSIDLELIMQILEKLRNKSKELEQALIAVRPVIVEDYKFVPDDYKRKFCKIKHQTPELCELAVYRDGLMLEFVEHQTTKLCELAVRQNGCALKYVKDQTLGKVQELAIRQNVFALAYVINQTPELCELAVRQNPSALMDVRSLTPELCELAVELLFDDLDLIDGKSIWEYPIKVQLKTAKHVDIGRFYTDRNFDKIRSRIIINITSHVISVA